MKERLKVLLKADYALLFILNAAGMILELVASRLMSPYFGNSNFVWTAIIGIILLAGSLGNILGGKLSAKKNARLYTGILLLLTVVYLAVTPLIDVPILTAIKDGNMGAQFSSVVGSIVFFLVPATIMGIVTPIIMKDQIGESKDKGEESGRITAIIAIGSLVGTFAGGFWLVPAMGTKMIFVLLAIIVLLSVPLLKPLKGVKNAKLSWAFFAALVVAIIMTVVALVRVNEMNSQATTETEISIDTEYGRIIIEEGTRDGEAVRYYKQSGAYSSATYISEDKKYDLVYDYLKKYDVAFEFLDVKEALMIGGAAYQYPKYYIANFPNRKMDVVEIDPVSTEIARKYFYLDDLVEDYGAERLGLYNEDGRVFMSNSTKKYDAVFNDAFSGAVPVGTLATVEAAELVKNVMTPGGVYLSNVMGAVSGSKSRFLKAEVKTLKQVFKHVYVMTVHENATKNQYVNWMVIATDNDYVPSGLVDIELTDDDIILTDDYCPVESLVADAYFD